MQSDEENTNNDKGEGLPFSYQEYFGIPNQPGKDFLVVLHPLRRGQSSLKVEDVGRPGNPVLRITNGTQVDTVELAATSAIINRQGPEKGRLVIRATQPVVPDELQ